MGQTIPFDKDFCSTFKVCGLQSWCLCRPCPSKDAASEFRHRYSPQYLSPGLYELVSDSVSHSHTRDSGNKLTHAAWLWPPTLTLRAPQAATSAHWRKTLPFGVDSTHETTHGKVQLALGSAIMQSSLNPLITFHQNWSLIYPRDWQVLSYIRRINMVTFKNGTVSKVHRKGSIDFESDCS